MTVTEEALADEVTRLRCELQTEFDLCDRFAQLLRDPDLHAANPLIANRRTALLAEWEASAR